MDAQGTDVQVISIHTPLFGYHLDAAQGRTLARDVNAEIAEMTRQWPTRFAGLATLPMQDVKSAIEELEYAVTRLGLKGAELDTNVNGEQWDEPKFLPFFKAAEAMGAVLFYHPQPQNNFLRERIPRHGLYNSLGVILDDAIVTAVMIMPGVQNPHCNPWCSRNASCMGWSLPSRASPSIVVTVAPAQAAARTMQDFTALPFRCTVHAPHWPVSQPS